MVDTDKYKAVNRYDRKGNQHNFQLFLRQTRASPWRGFAIGVIFTAVATATIVIFETHSVKLSMPWQKWALVSMAGLVALLFFYQSLRGLLQRKSDEQRGVSTK